VPRLWRRWPRQPHGGPSPTPDGPPVSCSVSPLASGAPYGVAFPRRSFLVPWSRHRRVPLARSFLSPRPAPGRLMALPSLVARSSFLGPGIAAPLQLAHAAVRPRPPRLRGRTAVPCERPQGTSRRLASLPHRRRLHACTRTGARHAATPHRGPRPRWAVPGGPGWLYLLYAPVAGSDEPPLQPGTEMIVPAHRCLAVEPRLRGWCVLKGAFLPPGGCPPRPYSGVAGVMCESNGYPGDLRTD
jgi:hypothetical protein